jgi:hypothetical protein
VKTFVALTAIAAVLAVSAGSADAARECDGLQVCVPVAGPWVVVPAGGGIPRREVEYQLSCPRGHVVGGIDAELSHRAIDVAFRGLLGSPVNPGITTARAVVFLGRYVGVNARGPTFRPRIGCLPGRGGGTRIPTSAGAFAPGQPTVRRVRTVRVRPGRATVVQRCAPRERLVAGFHAFGFFTRRAPQAALVSSVSGRQSLRGGRVVVAVRGDAELQGVHAVVQVQALCARVR